MDGVDELISADEWLVDAQLRYCYMTSHKNEDNTYTYTTGGEGGSLMLVYDTVGDSLYLRMVPEPATATLGLLALAALGARRRRNR